MIVVVSALAVLCPSAGAFVFHGRHGTFLGVNLTAGSHLPTVGNGIRTNGGSSTALEYHGGDVLHSNKAYAIFWDPASTYPTATKEAVTQYFTDVTTDSGQASNVYSITSQYTDAGGSAAYNSSFGGALVDTSSYPTQGTCSDPMGSNPCISDTALQAEVASFVEREHLPTSATAIYFVFLPENVVSCLEGGICSDTSPGICAYHKSTPAHVLYASIPYLVGKECQSDGNGATQQPNGNAADVLVKTVSHEHIETITDPAGQGWFNNKTQAEIGDKCNRLADNANAFLPTLGGDATQGTLYNQLIGGHQYYLQSEWSNNGERCAMGFSPFQREEVFIGVANGRVQRRTAAGALNGTLQTRVSSYTTGMAFDRQDNLYVTDFGAGSVSRFDALGNLEGTFGLGFSNTPESILFDKAGNAYVGQVGGGVLKFDENGNLLTTIPTGRSDWIDLGADQCTLYYTDEGETGGIMRYNACANEPMPEFVPRAAVEHPYALRLLPSGGLLVADTSVIRRFDESGNQTQTYGYPGNSNWFALNLDPGGTAFYSADLITGSVVKFDIASGDPLLAYNTGTGESTVFGIVVNGELTLGSGAEVFGTVKDHNGAGVIGALVQACPAAGGSCFETTSNPGGGYHLAGLNPGDYAVSAFPPAGASLGEAGIGPVHLSAGQTQMENLVLPEPGPPPPNVTISPTRATVGGIPVVDFGRPFALNATGCPGGSATYVVKPFLSYLMGLAEGGLAESPPGSGTYTAMITPPVTWFGPSDVRITIVCPGGKHEESAFTLYIDPSGKVVTDTGHAVSGAIVTLYRGEGPLGPFAEVPNGNAVMSPMNRANPDITQADGSFGWDVIAGYYEIRAEKAGCSDPADSTLPYVSTEVFAIPPSMANLTLTLHCVTPPTSPDSEEHATTGAQPPSHGGVLGFGAATPTAPHLSALTILPGAFRAAASGATLARSAGGTVVSYTDSQAAISVLRVERVLPGVLRNGRCEAGTGGKPHVKRCARIVDVGRITHADSAGRTHVRFTGRVKGKKLTRGHYRLVITGRNSAGTVSNAVWASFTVLA
jgi:Carboxypeptidase regulatory-like domain/Phosphate-induced protein 1 conserved region